MKKILIIVGIVLIAYLIIDGSWTMTATAFGTEYTFSIALLIIGFIALYLFLRMLKKPFQWIQNYRTNKSIKTANQRGDFWQLVLTTVLDKDDQSIKKIIKEKRKLFSKNSQEDLLLQAVFTPSEQTFESLLNFPETKLAGLYGLIQLADKAGNLAEQERLLTLVETEYPKTVWAVRERLNLSLLQSDYEKALSALESLHKTGQISPEDYTAQKAEILYKLGDFKGAFKLVPDNVMFALGYATATPKKAADILADAWKLAPDWTLYTAFRKLILRDPFKKQLKAVDKFVHTNMGNGLGYLAMADIQMDAGDWADAKDNVTVYLDQKPLSRQAALMMERIERDGYHHTEAATEWAEKANGL